MPGGKATSLIHANNNDYTVQNCARNQAMQDFKANVKIIEKYCGLLYPKK